MTFSIYKTSALALLLIATMVLSPKALQAQSGPRVDESFQVFVASFGPYGIEYFDEGEDWPVGIFYGKLFETAGVTALCGAFSSAVLRKRSNSVYLRGSYVRADKGMVKDLRFLSDMISQRPALLALWEEFFETVNAGRRGDLEGLKRAGLGLRTSCKRMDIVWSGNRGPLGWSPSNRQLELDWKILQYRSVRRKR